MKLAVRKSIRAKIAAGLPVYVARNGKVVNLNPQSRPRTKSGRAA